MVSKGFDISSATVWLGPYFSRRQTGILFTRFWKTYLSQEEDLPDGILDSDVSPTLLNITARHKTFWQSKK